VRPAPLGGGRFAFVGVDSTRPEFRLVSIVLRPVFSCFSSVFALAAFLSSLQGLAL
jgi:hypothetical protein